MHHAVRLDAHEAALRDGRARRLRGRADRLGAAVSGFHEQRFALAEALAHLERLGAVGRAVEVEPGRWRAGLSRLTRSYSSPYLARR